jgi:hypothetical protein
VNFGGRPIPGYSWDKRGRRISDEQIKEWLCEAIEGDCYNYGYVKRIIYDFMSLRVLRRHIT